MIVTAYNAALGHYILSVEQQAGGAVLRERGKLSAIEAKPPRGARWVAHQLDVDDGQSISARLTSRDFDPLLVAISPSGRRYVNDDGIDLNSLLEISRAQAGRWRLLASSVDRNASGAYELTVPPEAGGPHEGDFRGNPGGGRLDRNPGRVVR